MDGMLDALDMYMQGQSSAYHRQQMIEDEMDLIKKNIIEQIGSMISLEDSPDEILNADSAIFEELQLTQREIYAFQGNFDRYLAHREEDYQIQEPEDGYSF